MEKKDDEKLKDVFLKMEQLKKQYNELSKEELVDLLVYREISNEACFVDENNVDLWCYVSDSTGLKYLTNELPIQYFSRGNEYEGVLLTKGNINIRVPEAMSDMFPDIKYGDEPVKVKITVTT